MIEELSKPYKHAQIASKVGAYLLYFLSLVCLSVPLVYLYAFTQTSSMDQFDSSWQLLTVIGLFATVVFIFLLAEFLRHFGRDTSPFGRKQSARLLAAGLLLVLRTVVDALTSTSAFTVQIADGLSLTSTSGVDLKVIAIIVFLICLAMVVRYGNALKVDSDSFG